MAWSQNVLPCVGFEHVYDSCSIYHFSIDFRPFKERESSCERQNRIYVFFPSETLVTHFLIVMVVCLIFMGKQCVKVTIPSLTSSEEA